MIDNDKTVIEDDGSVSKGFLKVELRPYQSSLISSIYEEWQKGSRNVIAALPTGGGKTVTFSTIIKNNVRNGSCAIAHRQELVEQISLSLAVNDVVHRIIGPEKVIKSIIGLQIDELGKSFYDPSSQRAVAGIDTLIRRKEELKRWLPTVGLWVLDEGHHALKKNKWGVGTSMFPNAFGLGVTASPHRPDGFGLGSHHDGVFDAMVIGANMPDLIDMGFLTEFRIFAPPSNLDMSNAEVSKKTGDFKEHQTAKAVHNSSLIGGVENQIVGDIVQYYVNNLWGKQAITFVPSVNDAERIAEQFRAMNVPAAALNANSKDRTATVRKFRRRELWQLINVDLFSEGFDVPGVEVVQDGFPTASFNRFAQRFGRMLRPSPGKEYGIYVDHAKNVERHARTRLRNGKYIIDISRDWTLDRAEKKSKKIEDIAPIRTCLNVECNANYERYLTVCPYCGTPIPEPDQRSGPQYVDGDLFELDAETFARMKGDVDELDKPIDIAIADFRRAQQETGIPEFWVMSNVKKFAEEREEAQSKLAFLREAMAWWAGHHRAAGRSDSEIFKIFYITFGIDWLSAQSADSSVMADLTLRVTDKMGVA